MKIESSGAAVGDPAVSGSAVHHSEERLPGARPERAAPEVPTADGKESAGELRDEGIHDAFDANQWD